MRRAAAAILLVCLVLSTTATARPAGPALLGLQGIGPLRLGMTRPAALATGWLAGRHSGCPLGGPPLPITYGFTGPRAPPGIRGTAEFDGGRLRVMSFSRGVRTTAGVVVGQTTAAAMTSRYRRAGFTPAQRFDRTFGGTFVTVTRHGLPALGAFSAGGPVMLVAIPWVPVCD